MIDIESAVYNAVVTAVETAYPNIACTSNEAAVLESLPALQFREASNTVYKDSITLDCRENHARVMYQADIYTDGDKPLSKGIAAVVDNTMQSLGFVRTYDQSTPDAYLCRRTMRFEAAVSKGFTNGNTTTHYVFNIGGNS